MSSLAVGRTVVSRACVENSIAARNISRCARSFGVECQIARPQPPINPVTVANSWPKSSCNQFHECATLPRAATYGSIFALIAASVTRLNVTIGISHGDRMTGIPHSIVMARSIGILASFGAYRIC